MTYLKRRIDLTFQLGKDATFGSTGKNTAIVTGKRVQVSTQHSSGPALGEANIKVYGLTPSLLNQLSALNRGTMAVRQNIVIVSAGDDVNGMAKVFEGNISIGQINMANMPESSLTLVAHAGGFGAIQNVPPLSYPGTTDAAIIMSDIAHSMGVDFKNHGVSKNISTPYYKGSPNEQADSCANDAGFQWKLRDKIMEIWPNNGNIGGQIPLISSDTGLVGYPNYSTKVFGVGVTTVFNPLLRTGGLVEIKSTLKVANGIFYVFDIQHEIESETPEGQWFTRFNASTTDVEH